MIEVKVARSGQITIAFSLRN